MMWIMKRRLASVIAFMLLFQAALHGQERAIPSPAEVLEQGVKNLQLCPVGGTKSVYDGEGTLVSETSLREEASLGKKVSLPLLFRANRFTLSPGYEGSPPDSTERYYVIDFSPKPLGEQIEAAKGEDKNFNKAINQLAGSVYFDPMTLEIMRIDVGIPKGTTVPYEVLGARVFELKLFSLLFLRSTENRREATLVTSISYWRVAFRKKSRNIREYYASSFVCGRITTPF